ncbi:hypothetical protein VTN02DRAFT_6059 [Thermoascus thermophilus]
MGLRLLMFCSSLRDRPVWRVLGPILTSMSLQEGRLETHDFVFDMPKPRWTDWSTPKRISSTPCPSPSKSPSLHGLANPPPLLLNPSSHRAPPHCGLKLKLKLMLRRRSAPGTKTNNNNNNKNILSDLFPSVRR